MPSENMPIDTSVAKFYINISKKNKFNEITIEEKLLRATLIDTKFNSYRRYFSLYIK